MLTEDELAEIEAELAEVEARTRDDWSEPGWDVLGPEAVPRLLAEVRRLRALMSPVAPDCATCEAMRTAIVEHEYLEHGAPCPWGEPPPRGVDE